MEEGMTLKQIDEMDIVLYFRLLKRKGKSSSGVQEGFIDQVM
ncbi:hypothetical protein NST48_09355 [Paenibacillus sp. FSL M7-0547]